MNIAKIEENIQNLMSTFNKNDFIYQLLLAYGQPKSGITRLKQGTYNLSKTQDEVLWKKKLFFKMVKNEDLHDVIDEAQKNVFIKKQSPRFLIVTDYKTFLAIDTKTMASLDIPFDKLSKNFDFFLPWAGLEKVVLQADNPADVKAAEKMARLYDQIKVDNPSLNAQRLHDLNIFLSRLLFCYFAEDTEIFEKGSFTTSIASHTNATGEDLGAYLDRLFEVLNTKDRRKYPTYLQKFPYVNGGLLAKKISSPKFSAKSRGIILECGELNWSEINPDIFGSMIQAVVHPSARGGMGMHYTSVPNIMKVINPLFLNDLYSEVNQAKSNAKKLEKILLKLSSLKIFDPACGSGNFLIIAYKELRKVEMLIYKYLQEISGQYSLPISNIKLTQFFGIEVDDFAVEIAVLSLWLAEHQMNLDFAKAFGSIKPPLPLREGGNIKAGNACMLDWKLICPVEPQVEIIVLGNPPYRGSSLLSKEQKSDVKEILGGIDGHKKLDYISCWFKKGADYIRSSNSKLAFVATSSICQGEQVAVLWPSIIDSQIEIGFAHLPFKWANQAKNNAGVSCVIVGLRNISSKEKYLYFENQVRTAQNINAYLSNYKNIYIKSRTKPISEIPHMVYGNKPVDGGNLILQSEEKEALLAEYPESKVFIRELLGADEFINGFSRWCLWIDDSELPKALAIPPIKSRIAKVKEMRLKSVDSGANALAKRSHQFRDRKVAKQFLVLVPSISSESREYIPIGFLDKNKVVNNKVHIVLDAPPHMFALLTSKMHMVWTYAVAGRLESRINYSSEICYNNFPIPPLNESQKNLLSQHALNVLAEREKYLDKNLADLYDPEKMPLSLKEAHSLLDQAVERCYRSKPFSSSEERIEYLFNLYEKMSTELIGVKKNA